jgi:predicted MFS family arabinose efflux permease
MLVTAVGARPVVELLPGFAADVFGSGAGGLAALTSAVGLGAIVGGVWIGSRRSSAGLTRIVLGGALGLGCSIALFTATNWLPLGVVIMVAGGFCMVCTGVAAQTLVQLAVASDMRGRVLSLYGLIFRGGPALGALTMGIASERLGLRWPVAIGCLAVILCWQWIRRRADVIAASLERTAAEEPAGASS